MRSLVLLLVGVAAVAALPLDDTAPSAQDQLLQQLLQAKPEDNDIIPEHEQDKLPSPAPSSPSPLTPSPPPSPIASPSVQDQKLDPTPAGQVSTPSGEQVNKNEEKQEQEQEIPKESDTQQQQEQEIRVEPLPQTEEKEEETEVAIEPLPAEPEVERVSSGHNVDYVVVEADSRPMILGQVDGPVPPEDEREELAFVPERVRTALVDQLHWPEEVMIMELPEGQPESGVIPVDPEVLGLPLAPEPEEEEPEEEELPLEPEMEPLPLDYEEEVGVDPGFTFPDEEEGEDPAQPSDMTDPDYDVTVDTQDEEYREPPVEEQPLPEDGAPMGFFSWVLPGFFDDRIITDSEPNGEEIPIIDVPVEHDIENEEDEDEGEEEEFLPEAAAMEDDREPGIVLFEENGPLDVENGPDNEESGPYNEENGADDEEEFNGNAEDSRKRAEELPVDEEATEDVYFSPGGLGMADEELPQSEDGLLRVENLMPEQPVYDDYGADENVPTVDYFIPDQEVMIVREEVLEKMPEMMPPEDDMLLTEDELPTREYHPIIFPDFSEDEVNGREEPFTPGEEYDADDAPVIIDPPHSMQIFTRSKPILPQDDRVPLRDILLPIMKMVAGKRDEGVTILGRNDAPSDPNGDMVEVIVMGSPSDNSDDTKPSLLPIAGDSVMPDGRPLPIAAYPDYDDDNQQPQWTPNYGDSPNAPFFTLNNEPNSFSVFYEERSDNVPYSSFGEPQVWPQREAPFRNNMENNMMDGLPPHHTDMHFHPSRFTDSTPPHYHPHTRYEKTFDSSPPRANVQEFSTFKSPYSEDFGFSHSHGPITPPRPFFGPPSSPHHYHRQDSFSQRQSLFPHSPRVTHSDYNVFRPTSGPYYRPEQDIYPSGPQSYPDSFYRVRGDLSHRPIPFTSFRRPQPQVDVEILPMEMTMYPNTQSPFSSPRPQFPFFLFPKEQPSSPRDTFTPSHDDMPFQYPTGSPLYPNFPPPFAQYAPGYPEK